MLIFMKQQMVVGIRTNNKHGAGIHQCHIWIKHVTGEREQLGEYSHINGCGMGPLLVPPCFRENVVATCKIGSFLCSLDNLLQENVIVWFFLEIKFQNGTHLKKGLFLTYFHIF